MCAYPPPLYPAVRVGSGMHVFPPSVLILERPGGRGRREGLSALYTDSCALGDGPVRAKGRSAPKEETGKTILERSKKPGRKKGGNAQPSPPHNLPGLYTTTSLALPLLIFKMLCSSILTRTMLSSHIRRKLY